MQKLLISVLLCLSVFKVQSLTGEAHLLPDKEVTYLTQVEAITHTEHKNVPGTDVAALYQTLQVMVIKGEASGKRFSVEDSTYDVAIGDKVYIKYVQTADGSEYYSMSEPYRLPQLGWLFALFIVCVVMFGGKQGYMSLVALFIACYAMAMILFPQLLLGVDPILISLGSALISLGCVMYVTHGFKRFTTAAYLGCILAVGITAILAQIIAVSAHLTGFAAEESVYLNMATHNMINFQSLIIAAMIIGVIGVVNDAAITQTSLVQEFFASSATISRKEVYKRAMKVGRDHIGALVNTLVFAYVGASLPIILLFYSDVTTTPFLELINREMIATELIRSMIGSIGLLLAIPCSTLIAVFLIKRDGETSGVHAHHH